MRLSGLFAALRRPHLLLGIVGTIGILGYVSGSLLMDPASARQGLLVAGIALVGHLWLASRGVTARIRWPLVLAGVSAAAVAVGTFWPGVRAWSASQWFAGGLATVQPLRERTYEIVSVSIDP